MPSPKGFKLSALTEKIKSIKPLLSISLICGVHETFPPAIGPKNVLLD